MLKYIKSVEEFNKEIKGNTCLVDFHAKWCGPCKMMDPVLEELAVNVDILKVDTDENSDLAREYGIMSIPTLLYIKDGKEKMRLAGYKSKSEIEEIME